ncbi:sulfotransferase family protein [Nocardioides terrisoli]|uniref:sulfotransferase family protein n=1 Tax=Nocardioides terrisoli TaxID=3388267 RepID=UPI00287B77F9|nr:sulfotransferase [Nocardioides marmorisolisilvae]
MRERESVGSYDEIVTAAVRATGLSDFGGDQHEEGLRVLLEDYRGAAGLTPAGNHRARGGLKGLLVARLMAEQGFAANPTSAQVPVERPVVVTGLPRSGTTLLQRLLTADPAHQGLEQWLADLPQPRPPRERWDDDPIFTAMQTGYHAFHEAHPELAGLHYSDAASHEECWRLLQQVGTSAAFETQALVPAYSEWLQGADWAPAYRRHRRLLQLIGLNDAEKRWILKNPSHLMALDALLDVYPDAVVVVTHRDPVTCVASMCSLAEASTRGTSTAFVGDAIGRTQLDLLVREHEAYLRTRSERPGAFVDVAYADLMTDPVGTVQGLYAAAGLPWGDSVRAAIEAELVASRSGVRAPRHSYALADFGLTDGQVRERLS